MARYVALGRFRGSIDLAQSPARVEKVKAALGAVGGRLESVCYTMGAYDFVTIFEVPDGEAAAAFLTWYAKLGVAETTTMPALSLDELVRASGRIK